MEVSCSSWQIFVSFKQYLATFSPLEIGDDIFESVPKFTFLGSMFNASNKILPEIKKRIAVANKTYYA